MADHPASDLFTVVRSQRAAVEAPNRTAAVRAGIRATIEAIARAEVQIQQARRLLDSEFAGG
jgi:hypothetical protein